MYLKERKKERIKQTEEININVCYTNTHIIYVHIHVYKHHNIKK